MNRSELACAYLIGKQVAETAHAMLNEEASKEFVKDRTLPSWKNPDFTASSSMTQPSVVIDDADAFEAFVTRNYPTEVETVTTVVVLDPAALEEFARQNPTVVELKETTAVRPAFRDKLLKQAVKGNPPTDAEGTVIPGLKRLPGGEFRYVSVKASTSFSESLSELEGLIRSGGFQLALPSAEVA